MIYVNIIIYINLITADILKISSMIPRTNTAIPPKIIIPYDEFKLFVANNEKK